MKNPQICFRPSKRKRQKLSESKERAKASVVLLLPVLLLIDLFLIIQCLTYAEPKRDNRVTDFIMVNIYRY